MSRNLNSVTISGRISRDLSTGVSRDQKPFTFFRVAVNRDYKDKNGATVKKATFVDCKLFGKSAENFAKFMKKGMGVIINGHLEECTEKRDSFEYKTLKIYVDDWFFPDGNKKEDDVVASTVDHEANEEADMDFSIKDADENSYDTL